MITQIQLQTFKCFKDVQLPLAPLTILSLSLDSVQDVVNKINSRDSFQIAPQDTNQSIR
jgi:hypothetical protein